MGGKTDESANRMFTMTDSFLAHMIRMSNIILVRLGRRLNSSAAFRRLAVPVQW